MNLRSIQNARRVSNEQWTGVEGISGLNFDVKPYQRGYRWGKNNVKKLLEDIAGYVKRIGAGSNTLLDYIAESCTNTDNTKIYDFYCLQALSIQKEDEGTYELIDGQQRITTVFLVLELLDVFINPREDRAEDPLYKIIYQRNGIEGDSFDLTYNIHNIIPSEVNGSTPRKEYRNGCDQRNASWFDDYKKALKKNILSLKPADESVDSLSVDLFYLSEAAEEIVDFIFNYLDDKDSLLNLQKYYGFLKQNVLFLWYEIPQDINPKKEFIGLNSYRIDLTNAELIKALVLKTDDHGNVFENAGHRWETIEQGLCRNELWAFISGEEKATRIDFVLELFARSFEENCFVPDANNEYALFDWFEELREQADQAVFSRNVIEGIEGIYNRICEWYDDIDIYHYIGLLTSFRAKLTNYKTQEEFIKSVFDTYSNCEDRDTFIIQMKKLIKNSILYGFKEEDYPQNIDDIENMFSYEDSSQHENMKAILWLLNAWETVESADNNFLIEEDKKKRKPIIIKRLPFSQITGIKKSAEEWTLEHIMPQTPAEEASNEDKTNYATLSEAIKRSGQEEYVISGKDVHRIGNMALLTRSTNSVIKNGNLEVKRSNIINMLGIGKYVPISTVNAFSLYYNMLDVEHTATKFDSLYWTTENKKSYIKRLQLCLEAFGIIPIAKKKED